MADGGLILTLSDDLARKIERGAAAAGLSREAYVTDLLEQQLFDYDDYRWTGDDPRASPEPYDPQAPTYELHDVMVEFRQELEKRLAAKA